MIAKNNNKPEKYKRKSSKSNKDQPLIVIKGIINEHGPIILQNNNTNSKFSKENKINSNLQFLRNEKKSNTIIEKIGQIKNLLDNFDSDKNRHIIPNKIYQKQLTTINKINAINMIKCTNKENKFEDNKFKTHTILKPNLIERIKPGI